MAGQATLSADEAVARLKISRPTLYAYVSRGLIRSDADPSDPRRSLYLAEDVERLVASKVRGRKPERIAESTLEWGLPVLESQITVIQDGRLFYRGQDATQLARSATLEEIAQLLWGCEEVDPFAAPVPPAPARWEPVIRAFADASPLARCLAALPAVESGALAMWQRDSSRLWSSAASLHRHVAAAAIAGRPEAMPMHELLAKAWGTSRKAAELIRMSLALCADHELNASTFAVRVVASTGASLVACVAAGLAALSGPRHGGLTARIEAWFDEIERSGDPARAVEERVSRGDPLPGFGHPLYTDGDPRARELLSALPGDRVGDGVITAVDRIGGKPPNIDFALVAMARALGLPRRAPLTLFAVGRTAGWIAHALEQQQDRKLIRPRARYVGLPPQD